MSGLEVAGLVLGSIPILVSLLQNYGNGITLMRNWRKREREVKSLIRNLDVEKVRLQNVCEKLLNGVAPPSAIEDAIEDPFGPIWKDEHIYRKIRARLWKGVDNFETTLGDIKEALEELKKRVEPHDGGRVSVELKLAAFTVSRERYEDSLTTIKNGISTLENIVDRNMELEPTRRLRSQGKFYLLLRDLSRGLYSAISSSLGCSCGHDVGLRLQARSADFMPFDGDQEITRKTEFQLALASSSPSDAGKKTWEEFGAKPVIASKELPSFPLSLRAMASPPLKQKRRVAFFDRPTVISSFTSVSSASASHSGTSTATISSGSTMIHQHLIQASASAILTCAPSNPMSDVLCEQAKSIIAQNGGAQAPTFLFTKTSVVLGSVSQGKQPQGPRHWQLISLADCLNGASSEKYYLPYKDRLHLAVVISSSVLQLYGSEWMRDIPGSQDVYFVTNNDGFPIYQHPLLIKDMATLPKTIQCGSAFEPIFASLGVLLVEVFLGATMRLMREQGSAGGADWQVAQQLLERGRISSLNSRAAVARCFDSFGVGQGDLDLADGCHDIYAGIVSLLEKDLGYT
ncbi:hypothetical protein B0I35DRAFT_350567 [Stachybotrys elegans]|uniref:DUF7580 domain-containing protein n=1 Tax=Stachybotrys elegans TaxID=80388 RepID=A0A8K0SXP9_9HYPO|nr:hypothetical protein B0I35DRAFT_350567 [Stachybotrys elegans]